MTSTADDSTSPPPPDAIVVMDRFVSATAAEDAVESLKTMVDGLKKGGTAPTKSDSSRSSNDGRNSTSEGGPTLRWKPAWILNNDDLVEHLVWLLQHSTLKDGDISCEEGVGLTCQLYTYLVGDKISLQSPRPGALLEALLDVLDHPEQHPVYVRVMALKLLGEISRRHAAAASNQWLNAPNGLYRLSDVIGIDIEAQPMEEAVRNEALNVAKLLAKNAPMAKVFVFAELDVKLFDLAIQEGGMTKGNPIVLDSLEIINELLKHFDAAMLDLVLQRPHIGRQLSILIDLRNGDEFRNPSTARRSTIKQTKKRTISDGDDDDDDLDNLLASGESRGKQSKQRSQENDPQELEHEVFTPRLTKAEEIVVHLVLKIIRVLLATDDLKKAAWKNFDGLCFFLWESALIYPSQPPVCACPSPILQQAYLEVVAECINDLTIMDRVNGLDRLLMLVCTGGASSEDIQERLRLSQTALAVLRKTLSGDRIHETLMRTLAPPPVAEDDTNVPNHTVVDKLWSTAGSSLKAKPTDERTILLSGSLGGLGLMLVDKESREIMSKVPPDAIQPVFDNLLQSFFEEKDETVQWSLLRFLCEWIFDCPLIAHKILVCPSSSELAVLASNSSKGSPLQQLVHLLLGLSMEYLTKEEDCGGWTRAGILDIISKIGISRFTSSLESLKSQPNPKMPWMISDSESKTWKVFCNHAVLVVRKRVVEELTGGGSSEDDSEVDNNAETAPGGKDSVALKSLQKLVAQQSKEMDELRIELERAQTTVASQHSQLDTWKKRTESTPTELDGMLNELTSKTATLECTVQSLRAELVEVKANNEKEKDELSKRLADTEREREHFRTEKQEARNELERTVQDMQALSQAYSNLEQDYQRNQQNQCQRVGAPTVEESSTQNQSQGEDSQQHIQQSTQSVNVSTEVLTLRAENARLQDEAQQQSDWIDMAVGRMSEMEAANRQLQGQIAALSAQNEQRLDLAVQSSQEELAFSLHQRQALESQLAQESSLRQAAEQQLAQLHVQQTQLSQEMEEKLEVTIQSLQSEKNARAELERTLKKVSEEKDQLLQLKFSSVKASGVGVGDAESSENLKLVEREAAEFKVRSEQEIYRLESIVRELQDRLGKNLGEYTVEDIRSRDEEIAQLHEANTAAQEWMAKAVEHHQRLSTQAATLENENTSLKARLLQAESKITADKFSEDEMEILKNEVSEKTQKLVSLGQDLSRVQVELNELRKEKEDHQGLLDELGIAMDDVGVMKQKLIESESLVKDLEAKLKNDSLSKENEELREDVESMEKEILDLRSWVEMAQQKMEELMAANLENEKSLSQAVGEVNKLQNELSELRALGSSGSSDQSPQVEHRVLIERLEAKISNLQAEKDELSKEKERVTSDWNILESKQNELEATCSRQKELLEEANGEIERLNFHLDAERQLSNAHATEIDTLKAEKSALEQAAAQEKESSSFLPLEAQQGSLEVAIEELKSRIEELEDELNQKGEELRAANEALSKGSDVVQQWEDRVAELEAALSNTRQEVADQEAEAQQAIDQWQASCNEAEDRCTELEGRLAESEAELASSREKISSLVEQNQKLHDRVEEMQSTESFAQQKSVRASSDEDKDLNDQLTLVGLQESLRTAEENATRHEERVFELESLVESLQTQLQREEEYSKDVVAQWQEACTTAESECAVAKSELEELKKSLREFESSNEKALDHSMLEKQLEERTQELQSAMETVKRNEILSDELKERISGLEDQLEMLQQQLESQRARSDENESMLREQLESAQSQCDTKQEDLDAALAINEEERQQLLDSMLKNDSMTTRLEELELEVESLREQLAGKEQEASTMFHQWEERLNAISGENNELRKEIERIQSKEATELIEIRQSLSEADDVVRQWEERVAEMNEQIMNLTEQLKCQEEHAEEAILQWENNSADLEERLLKAELDVSVARRSLLKSDWLIEQLRATIEQNLVDIDELQSSLSQVSASDRDELERTKQELSQVLVSLEAERRSLSEEKDKVRVVQEGYDALSKAYEELKSDSEETVDQWTERCKELEAAQADLTTLKDNLQQQLETQEQDANEAIASWEYKAEELETDLEEMQDQLTALREQLFVTDDDASSLLAAVETLQSENKIFKTKFEAIGSETAFQSSRLESLNHQINRKDAEVNRLRVSVDELNEKLKILSAEDKTKALKVTALEADLEQSESKLLASEKVAMSLKDERDDLKQQLQARSSKTLEDERDRLTVVVSQLESELQAATEMVQACITDQSTERATEAVAESLREEIHVLRNQLSAARLRFDEESAQRELFELENNRLRDDLAALVSLSNQENTPRDLKSLTTKAIDHIQKKERNEIEELRNSLVRALKDLEISRSAEKEASEAVAKAELRLQAYEQNLVDAKSEINFLAGAMEDMRQTEESKRASLEFRIDSLENQNDVMRKYHDAELESVRNELSQITMEKDRLLHQLRESEKTNASLLVASSSRNALEGGDIAKTDLESECAKLRFENAHLLAMAADNKTRAERRLREMIAAQSASIEADVIMEQELRLKAESTVQALQAEIDILRREKNPSQLGLGALDNSPSLDLVKENKLLKANIEKMKSDNDSLRSQMKDAEARANSRIEALTEDYEKLQVKISRIEFDGKRDLAIQAEMVRTRDDGSELSSRKLPPDYNTSTGGDLSVMSSCIDAFEQIQQQKHAIQEERKLYQEVLSEQEELFALLAQRDVQLECLKNALIEAVGQEAVDKANEEAEASTISKYGNFIQVIETE